MKYVYGIFTLLVIATVFNGLIVACKKETSEGSSSISNTNTNDTSTVSEDAKSSTTPTLIPPTKPQLSQTDMEFLSSARRYGAELWSTWNTASDQEKIILGQNSCSMIDNSDFASDMVFRYGGNPNNSADIQGASAVVVVGTMVYCPDKYAAFTRQSAAEARRDIYEQDRQVLKDLNEEIRTFNQENN